jgi:hypothetical protein
MTETRREHWDDVYGKKREDEVSWFESEPKTSLALVDRCAPARDAKIIDIGGGASRFVDALLDRGFSNVTVLDVSQAALDRARTRLGTRADRATWIASDVTTFTPAVEYAIWHDRAVFHFLTDAADRTAYVRALERGVAKGGHAIIGTFALDGPEKCSGLSIVRYDAAAIAKTVGASFALVDAERHEHVTPAGKTQPFTFARFVRT